METNLVKVFMMRIEDRFDITGKCVVVTGCVATGNINVGDKACITDRAGNIIVVTIKGIEQFNKTLDSAYSGDNVGIVVDGITKAQISCGDLLYKVSLK